MTAIVCKRDTCGHGKHLHNMEMEDKQCSLCFSPPCWNFIGVDMEVQETAKQEQSSSSVLEQQKADDMMMVPELMGVEKVTA